MNIFPGKWVRVVLLAMVLAVCLLHTGYADEVLTLEKPETKQGAGTGPSVEENPMGFIPEDVEVFFICNVEWVRKALIAVFEEAEGSQDSDYKKGLEDLIAAFSKTYHKGKHVSEGRQCQAALKEARLTLETAGFGQEKVPSDDQVLKELKKASASRKKPGSSFCPTGGVYHWDENYMTVTCSVHGSATTPTVRPPAPKAPTLSEAVSIIKETPTRYGMHVSRLYLFSGGKSCPDGAILAAGAFVPEKVKGYLDKSAARSGAAPPVMTKESGGRTIFSNNTPGKEGKMVFFRDEFMIGGKPERINELVARDFKSVADSPDRFADVLSIMEQDTVTFTGKVFIPPGSRPAPLPIAEWPFWIRFELSNQVFQLVAEFPTEQSAMSIKQMTEVLKMQGMMALGTKISQLEQTGVGDGKSAPSRPAHDNLSILKRCQETLQLIKAEADKKLFTVDIPLGDLEKNVRFMIKSGGPGNLPLPGGLIPVPGGMPSIPGLR